MCVREWVSGKNNADWRRENDWDTNPIILLETNQLKHSTFAYIIYLGYNKSS